MRESGFSARVVLPLATLILLFEGAGYVYSPFTVVAQLQCKKNCITTISTTMYNDPHGGTVSLRQWA